MKINWVISDIENKLNNAKLSMDSMSIKSQFVYMKMLSDLNCSSTSESKKITRAEFFSLLNQFELSNFYNPFFNLISYLYEKIENMNYSFEEEFEDKEPDEIIKLARSFYRQSDKDSLSTFRRILRNDNCIQFVKNPDLPSMGRAYYINQDEYYMLINGRSYLEDALSLVHESKHIDMFIRGYNHGLSTYNELAPILYEMKMIDFLEESEDIGLLRINNINKYIQLIRKIGFQINLIKSLRDTTVPNNVYDEIYNNYYRLYDVYGLGEIYNVLNVGYSRKTIGKVISFIVATDIYLNTKANNINNVLTCYIFGMYKIQPSILAGVAEYIEEQYKPYKKLYKN